jgi:selenide,water dikinase
MVHPNHILTKGGAQPGDLLILSKPLGTGLLTTAHKRDLVTASDLQAATTSMTTLNRRASEALVQAGEGVHAVTDITGFGLLGHAWEMASQSLVGMRFAYDTLPLLPNALRYADAGCIPGGAGRNEQHIITHTRIAERLNQTERAILWDPQTSGGLFSAIDPALWPRLSQLAPDLQFWRIGEVSEPVQHEASVILEVY